MKVTPLPFALIPDFAPKLFAQCMKVTSHQFEQSKSLSIEHIVSHHFWCKMVSFQYNLYSRCPRGAQIAGNGVLLLQLRLIFMAFMMTCKGDPTRGSKPQALGRLWILRTPPDTKQMPRDAHFVECKNLNSKIVYADLDAMVSMLGSVQWLMDYLVFVV